MGERKREQGFDIPLVGGRIAQLLVSYPLSEGAWEHLLRSLNVMRDGIVQPEPEGVEANIQQVVGKGERHE